MYPRTNSRCWKRCCSGPEPCCRARNWRIACTVGTSRSAAMRSKFTFTACGGSLEAMLSAPCAAWAILSPKHEVDSRTSAGRIDHSGGPDFAACRRGDLSARVERDIDAVRLSAAANGAVVTQSNLPGAADRGAPRPGRYGLRGANLGRVRCANLCFAAGTADDQSNGLRIRGPQPARSTLASLRLANGGWRHSNRAARAGS